MAPFLRSCATARYAVYMTSNQSIPIRTLRNDVSQVIKRVEAGESFDVTRNGLRVAHIQPVRDRGRWQTVDDFRASVQVSPADPEFLSLLHELRAGSIDDPFERWGEV